MNRLRRAVAAGAALGVLLPASWLALALPAAAAEPVFATPTATETFGQSISIEQRVTIPGGIKRIEAYVRTGADASTFLAEISVPAEGAQTLRYTDPTPFGSLYPNTHVQIGFRITFNDGHVVDGPPATLTYADTRFAWRTLEGSLVRVHWYRGTDAFGRRALDIGEKAVEDASKLLGVTETDPIDYFIYADQSAFYDVLGPAIRENVGGIALPEIRTLFANIAPSDENASWVGIVVPHELTHLVFGTATNNPYHDPPHWMNEGLAVYLSEGYSGSARANVERVANTGEIMPLRALIGQFPTSADRFGLAYDESVSAIDFLIRTYGQDALVKLIRSYAGGVSDDEAFSGALGVDANGFEKAWLADLGVDEPVPYGPVAAPAGPVPPDWAAPGAPTTPQPTVRTDVPGSGDVSGPITIGVLAALAAILVVGLVAVARGLSRGAPLLAPLGETREPDPEDTAAPDDHS